MLNFIKGAIIGIALVIPGLSGSIFAVVVGLYDRLLQAVNHFRANPKKNLRFLAPIGLGAVVGILVSTKAVLVVTTHWPLPSYGFFIGLVLGIGPFIYRKLVLKPFTWWYLLLVAGGFAGIYGLAKLGGTQPENLTAIQRLSSVSDAGVMAFAGIFAVALMAIPGISGSVMLMVIDQYGTVYNAVSQLGDAARAFASGNWSAFNAAMGSVALLLPFMLGAIAGLIAVAKLMAYLLEHFETQVYYAVCGIVAAAVVILLETGIAPYWPATGMVIPALLVVVSLIIGVLATIFLDKPESNADAN